jgi:guanylate kinase
LKPTNPKSLFSKYPSTFAFSVSHTTRQPRKGEVDGINYNFCKKEEFLKLKDAGGFIETAEFRFY